MARIKIERAKIRPEKTLTAIRLEGFKSFRTETEAKIRPLTLLAGANSGGKSSLIQPLLLLKQTLEAPFDPGPLLLDGPLVKVEEASTLAWRGKGKSDRAKQWWIETEGHAHVRTTFSLVGGKGGLKLESTEDFESGAVIRERMTQEELRAAIPAVIREFHSPDGEFEVVRDRSQFRLNIRRRGRTNFQFEDVFFSISHSSLFLDLIHLPGLRGNPERAYRLTQATERFPGPFQTYAAGLLLGWKEEQDDRLGWVGDDLRTLGLSWKVDPRRRGDTAVEVQIGRLPGPQRAGAQDTVNIADVGFGASQVLPVVVSLQAARPGQVVHIEQPELHLHPKAQRLLADLLINAAKRGVIVIAETHSSVLLTAVQLRVAEGRIAPEEVALHWFSRDDDGISHIRTADLDRSGAYGDWPVDFADVQMAVERDYIDAAFSTMKA